MNVIVKIIFSETQSSERSTIEENIRDGNYKKGEIPQLWDGFSTRRIIEFLNKKLLNHQLGLLLKKL